MKVLHVSWGFSPFAWGGLIEYVEDLMATQVSQGYEISCFFAARCYPFFDKPRLIRWRKKKIRMFEIINSPLSRAIDKGVARPDWDLAEPVSEGFFREALKEVKPDLIHVQILLGLPSSLIHIAKREFNIPVVITLHDYFPLCPTMRLFDYSHQRCTAQEVGETCAVCCQNPVTSNPPSLRTLIYELRRLGSYHFLRGLYPILLKLPFKKARPKEIQENKNLPYLFQKRRDVNLERLQEIDLFIAQSQKVGEVYQSYLRGKAKVVTLHSSPTHLQNIKAKEMKEIVYPIQFATINGCVSIDKGALLIFESVKNLNKRGLGGKFQFHIYGWVTPSLKDCLNLDNVIYHGPYEVSELDSLLDRIHVGVIPSLWEETFGYTGIEFLAKGIPVIGNARGGIPEYTKDNLTGWLNKTASAEELTEIMERIINAPREIVELNHKITAHPEVLPKNMDHYFSEIEKIYNTLL